MHRTLMILSLFIAALLVQSFQPVPVEAAGAVGSAKCKMCHNKADTGAQFKQWEGTDHAKAYKTLASEKAKKIAAEKGIADPQKDAGCLACHTVPGAKPEEGVGCEACHGGGEVYMKLKKDAKTPEGIAKMKAAMVEPSEAGCKKCHNEKSPTYKPFKYGEMKKKISHPNPAKK